MNLEDIASGLMFTGIKESTILEDWEYRKGKGIEDIKKSISKACLPKYGMGKTELELDWLTLFLKDVLKKRRK